MDGSLSISALWGPRPETLVSIARRCRAATESLETVDPIFTKWFIARTEDDITELPPDVADIERAIAARRPFDPTSHNLHARTDRAIFRGPDIFSLSVQGGSSHFNCVVLGTDHRQSVSPSLASFRLFRAALLIVVETFDAERAYGYPASISPFRTRQDPRDTNPDFPIAWLSYVAARSAQLVTPPGTAIVERRPNGGLFMAATDETFDVANPSHMAVARDIEAAVAPLRARPWQSETPVE